MLAEQEAAESEESAVREDVSKGPCTCPFVLNYDVIPPHLFVVENYLKIIKDEHVS